MFPPAAAGIGLGSVRVSLNWLDRGAEYWWVTVDRVRNNAHLHFSIAFYRSMEFGGGMKLSGSGWSTYASRGSVLVALSLLFPFPRFLLDQS